MTLDYVQYGIFLIMGKAGFTSSTVRALTTDPLLQGADVRHGHTALVKNQRSLATRT